MNNKIGVDIDGVISDIAKHIIDYAAQKFGCVIPPEQITSDRMENCTNLSAEQLISIFQNPEFFRTLPLISSTRDWLNEASRKGSEIVLMTDRFWYSGIEEDTRCWLGTHQIPFDVLEFTRRAQKAERARELAIRIFLEDQLSNANMLAEVCERVFLLDRTYNQGEVSPNVIRISTCSDCLDSLN